MTANQLLRDQSHMFRDFPTEDIVIGGQRVPCLVVTAETRNRWEDGGLGDSPNIRVICERSMLLHVPAQGEAVMFRGQTLRVVTAVHDHVQSPVRVELESQVAGR
jgi:hypothetical protein